MSIAIYPGTFDPVTNGHVDLVERASQLFDHILIAVAVNQGKTPLFSVEERVQLLQQVFAHNRQVSIVVVKGLLVEFAHQHKVDVIIRGIRTSTDFDYELQMAVMNRQLQQGIETVFLVPAEQYSFISSTLVREIARLGGDVARFVPESVAKAIAEKY